MAIVSIETLKTYFETNDKPTQAQFVDLIDTLAFLPEPITPIITTSWQSTLVSSNVAAINSTQYIVVANATFTDPNPIEGKGYQVYMRNGTATIGTVPYSLAGTVIWRVFHSGAWKTYVNGISGSFNPTFVSSAPSDADMIPFNSIPWHYTRNGDVITLLGTARITFSNDSNGAAFQLDLSQFMPDNFASDDQANCVIGIVEYAGISDIDSIVISSVIGDKKTEISVNMLNPNISIKLGFTITFKLP